MLGSSSTTRRRASGAESLPVLLTAPPVERAVVVMSRGWAHRLEWPWAFPVRSLDDPGPEGARPSAAHRPATPPVADRVVLRPAQPPPAAEVRAHRTDGGGLSSHPGEQVLADGPVQ